MSTKYLVAFDSDTFSVAPGELADSLRSRWPQAEVSRRELPEGVEVGDVSWELPADAAGLNWLDGHTSADGRCIYLEGEPGLVADFALWYRGLVPAGIDVIFCDEGYAFDVAVDADTTRDELVDAATS